VSVERELTVWSLRRQATQLWGLYVGTVITKETKRNQTTLHVHHATAKWQSCCCCFIRKKNKNYFFVGLFVCLSKMFLRTRRRNLEKNKPDVIKTVCELVLTIFQSGQDGNKAKMLKLEWFCCKGGEF